MKRLKIACLCLVLITGPVILDSCICYFPDEYYDIDDLALMVTPFPAAAPYPAVTVPSPKLESLAFVVKIDVTYLSSVNTPTSGFTAVACSPPLPFGNQTIESFHITSNSNFTTLSRTVTAGSSLNEFFYVHHMEYPGGGGLPQVEDLIYYPYLETFSLHTNAELDKPQTHTFTITIRLDDGRLFEVVSDPLDLAQG